MQEQLEQAQVGVKERTEILKTIRADNNSKPKLQQAISNIIGKPEDKKKNRRPRNKKEELALVMEDTVDGDYTMEKRMHEGILREVKSYREDILARDYRRALQQMDAFEKAQSEMTEDAFDSALDNVENYFKYDRTTRLLMEAQERAKLIDLGMKKAEENEELLAEDLESKADLAGEDLESKMTEASAAP